MVYLVRSIQKDVFMICIDIIIQKNIITIYSKHHSKILVSKINLEKIRKSIFSAVNIKCML